MLKLLLDEGKPVFPMFCNTGKEYDETLDFVHEMETRWGVPFAWLEYTRVPASSIDPLVYPHKKSQQTVREQADRGENTHWFKVVNHETARRRDQPNTPFDEMLGWVKCLPNVRSRSCSIQLKIRTMMRYLFSLGIYEWTDYIGIRADEAHRAWEIASNVPKYKTVKFPLIERKINEADVLKFWSEQPFDLQLRSLQGNCDMCFLKAKHKRIQLAREDPGALVWWESWEEKFARTVDGDGKYFRKSEPYAYIRTMAEYPNLPFDAEDIDVPCGCGDKGFVISERINCEA